MTDTEDKKFIIEKLETLKGKGVDQLLINLGALNIEDLRLLAGSLQIQSAFLASGKRETVDNLYKQLEAKGVKREVDSDPAKDPTKPAKIPTTADGQIDVGAMVTGFLSVAVPAYFVNGNNLLAAAKAGLAGAGVVGTFDNWDDIKKFFEPVLASLGAGVDGAGGMLGGLFNGAGGLLSGAGESLGDLFNNPKLQELLETAKNRPITALAIAYAVASSSFTSIGGVFEFCKTALLALAVAWVAEQYLGMDGTAKGQIYQDKPEPAKAPVKDATPATSLPALPLGAVQIGN